jgi:RimJ/RimL family protein N-acetyltransferase
MLTVRSAVESDSEQFLAWRNDPLVVASSFTEGRIEQADHQRWFLQKLANADCGLYVVESEAEPAGQFRFDIDGSEAMINYSLGAAFRGRGLATESMMRAITAFHNDHADVSHLVAFVKPDNVASCRIFEKLHFEHDGFDAKLQANRYRIDLADQRLVWLTGD